MITAFPMFITALLLPMLGKLWKYIAIVVLFSTIPLITNGIFPIVLLIALSATLLHIKDGVTALQTLFLGVASFFFLEAKSVVEFVITFEALSIISFILLSKITNRDEAEATVTLFIMGAIASGIIFLGTALFVVGGGDISSEIYNKFFLENLEPLSDLSYFGLVLVFLGVFYKFSVLPMQNWAITTYTKGNFVHVAIISGIVKSVIVVGTFRLFQIYIIENDFTYLFLGISIASMFFGNFSALFQTRVSKILAYSSVAQAGYMILPFVAVDSDFAGNGIIYMAVAYIFMQTSIFLLLDIAKVKNLDDLKGLGKRNPVVALFFAIQLFSLAGIPLLAGFMSKAVVFYAVVESGFWWVALIAFFNSALSVGYYAWIVKNIYFDKNEKNTIESISGWETVSQTVFALGTILFGIFAGIIIF
jgi:NADH:ubiquinone oxidoreductase subunit 2 (subunit N)